MSRVWRDEEQVGLSARWLAALPILFGVGLLLEWWMS